MVTLAVVVLGVLLQGVAPTPIVAEGLGPLTVMRDRDAPLLVVHESRRPPLIAIRLSVPATESPELAGAGRALQLLVEDRARAEVARFGGKIEFSRTPAHLVYAVRGPATAFGEMVAVLKYAVAPPLGNSRAHSTAWLMSRQESLADFETPDRLVRQRLEALLFPDLTPVSAAPALQELPSAAELESFWRRWFRPERMSVVVVGAISPEEAHAAFRGWPVPPAVRARPPFGGSTPETPPRAEVMGARVGLGYPAGAAEPAALALAAALIEEALRTLELRQTAAELWWVAGRTALVVMGAASPMAHTDITSLRTTLQLSVAGVAARASAADLNRLRRRLRHALLMRARTTGGMAAVLGEFLDRTGAPESANEFLSKLAEVDDEVVRSTLRTLLYRHPEVVELQP